MNTYNAQVAEPYAEALISFAQENDLVEQFGDEMRSWSALLAECQELNAFITNPLVKSEDKKAVIQKLLGEDSHPFLKGFLFVLVDRRRIMFLADVAEAYLTLLRKFKNIVLAEVSAASALNGDQEKALVEKVKKMTNAADVELRVQVKAELIGGVVIKVGSQVLDASIKGQLRRLSLKLTAPSS